MTKAEIKKAPDNKLIVDYVHTQVMFALNYNLGGGVKRFSQHLQDLETELASRGILTEEDVKQLNA